MKWILTHITLLLALFAVSCFGGEGKKFVVDFTGGLNTQYDASRIGDNQAQSGTQNCDTSELILKTRGGFTLWGTQLPMAGGTPVYSVHEYKNKLGRWEYVVQCGSKVFTTTDDGASWTELSNNVSIYYPLKSSKLFGKIFFTNGIDPVYSYDGLSWSSHTFIRRGREITSYKGSLVISGNSGSPSSIFYSKPGADPSVETSWPVINELFVNRDDGQPIIAIAELYNKLIALKSNSIYGITDFSYVQQISRNIGCKDSGSVVKRESDLVFLGNDGPYALSNTLTYLGDVIRDDINAINQMDSELYTYRLSDTDNFNEGTLDGVEVSSNAVSLKNYQKTWSTDADFNAGTRSYITVQTGVGIALTTNTVPTITKLTPGTPVATSASNEAMPIQYLSYAVDNDSGNKTSIPITPSYVTTPQSSVNDNIGTVFTEGSYSGYYGATGDYVAISIPFTTPRIIKQMNWDYGVSISNSIYTELAGTENYLGKIYVRIMYRDLLTNDYKIFGNNTTNPDWERVDVPPLKHDDVPEGFNWLYAKDGHFLINNWNGSYYNDGPETNEIRIELMVPPYAAKRNTTFTIYEISFFGYSPTNIYVATGTWESAVYDTGIQTPRWSQLNVTLSSSPTNNDTKFFVKTSSDNVTYSDYYSVTPGSSNYNIPSYRYAIVKASFTSTDGTAHSAVQRIELNATAATGTYISPAINLNSVGTFHVFDADDTKSGETISYFYRSSGTQASLANVPWSDLTDGVAFPGDTSYEWVQFKSSHSTTMGDRDPYTQSFTLGWFEGNGKTPCASAWYNRAYWLGYSNTYDYNDEIYMLDKNNAWNKYVGNAGLPIEPGFLTTTHDNKLLAGRSNHAGISQLDYGTADYLYDIPFVWISKTFEYFNSLDEIDKAKEITKISIVGKSATNAPVYIGFGDGYGTTFTTFTITLPVNEYDNVIKNINKVSPRKSWKFKIYQGADGGTAYASQALEIRSFAVYYDIFDEVKQ